MWQNIGGADNLYSIYLWAVSAMPGAYEPPKAMKKHETYTVSWVPL